MSDAPKDPRAEALAQLAGITRKVREVTNTAKTFQAALSLAPYAPKRALKREEIPAIVAGVRQRFAELAALQAFLKLIEKTKETP